MNTPTLQQVIEKASDLYCTGAEIHSYLMSEPDDRQAMDELEDVQLELSYWEGIVTAMHLAEEV